MTISTTTNRYSYSGNGTTTVFSYASKFLANADLVVLLVDADGVSTTQVLDTDYTVAGAGVASGGTVTMTTAPASGETLVIYGDPEITQTLDLVNNDSFDADDLEETLDRSTLINQRQADKLDRSLRLADSDTSNASTEIVTTNGAGKFVRLNNDGDGFELVDGEATSDTFTASGTGAVSRAVSAKLGEIYSVKDFGAVGSGAVDDAAAVQLADDAAAANGADVYFPPGAYKFASKVTKNPYTNWIGVPNSQFGVTANDAAGTSGSRIVAGYNGTLVEIDDPGSEVYCGYVGFRGLSFFNNPATYAAAKAIVFNDNARQIVVEDFLIKGFEYGLYGAVGELYLSRGYVLHTKWGGYFFSSADCWFDKVHFGSGSQTVYASGGIGLTLINCNNIVVDNCRLQVQISGPGCQVQSSRGIHFINPIVDQNDTNGIEIIDSTDVDIDTPDIFDNGTVSVNAAGVKITAQGYDFTANAGTDIITLSSSSATWASSAIVELTTTGTLPAGLATGTQYYVIAQNGTTTFKLASSFANARAGTPIDISDAGTGTHTIHALCGYINIVGGRIQDRNLGTAAARQNRCVLFSKGSGGGKIRNINLDSVDVTRMTQVFGSTSSVDSEFRITNCPGWDEMSADNGNAGTTLTIGDDAKTQIWNTPLTAGRSVTLATTGLYEGAVFHIIRTAASTGAFNLSIGGLKNLAVGEWCVVEVFNGAWALAAFGAL